MEGNQTDEYIHRQGSAIANGIEGPRGRDLDVGVLRDIQRRYSDLIKER